MGMLDGLLAQVTGKIDVAALAGNVGLSGEQVEQAIAALNVAHAQSGDTVADAATETGLSSHKPTEIVDHVGGQSALRVFAEICGGPS